MCFLCAKFTHTFLEDTVKDKTLAPNTKNDCLANQKICTFKNNTNKLLRTIIYPHLTK